MFNKISFLTLAVLCTSVLTAEIGSLRRHANLKSEESSRRHKRFIIQFQVPSPVGHFQVAMVPPFISNMMASIPNMIRRNFLFGGFQQQQNQQQQLQQQQQQLQQQEQQQQQQQYDLATTEPLPY